MRTFTPRRLATTVSLALLPGMLQAQGVMMEEIVVTAQKREQNVQDVGIAISAFSGEQMERLGYDNAQQVTSMAPGVSTIQPNGEANYAIGMRGVATSDFTTNVESPVALYLDEVYISQMSGAGFQLYDMERVELLRGPQGTLFGRNATGGLAHFVSRKPTQDFEGYVKATLGDYDQYKYEGAVGGGLGDSFAVRLSGTYNQADGYVSNRFTGEKLNNQDDYSTRLHMLFTPSEDLEILLTARKAEQDIDTGFFENVSSIIPGKLTPARFNYVLGYTDHDGDVWAGDYDRTGFNELDTDGGTLTVKWAINDSINLTSITDRSDVERHYIEDSDASPAPVFSFFLNTDAEQTSQELRLDGDCDRLKWVAGLYYLNLEIDDNNGAITDPFIRPVYDGAGIPATPGSEAGLLNPYERSMDSYSAFGQLEYSLNDKTTLIGGLRFIRDDNEFHYETNAVEFINPNAHRYDDAGNLANPILLMAQAYEGEREDEEWSGRLQLNYTPNDDLLLYGSLNRGVRGGGYNAPIFPLTAPLDYVDEVMTYDPEQLDAIEVGAKWTFMDGMARLNTALYYYDYSDYQAFYIVGIDTITFNTDATSTGGEVELIVNPVENLDLLFGTAYNDIDVDVPDTLFGAPLPGGGREAPSVQSPEWTFNAMARYGLQTGMGEVAFQADFLWRDEHFFALTGFETVRENGYAITNASVTWTDPDQHWQVSAFMDNVFDEEYIVQTFDLSGPTVFGMTEQYYGRPRWWGLSARYSFGG
jgi:iron complex outermembrane receptor protein